MKKKKIPASALQNGTEPDINNTDNKTKKIKHKVLWIVIPVLAVYLALCAAAVAVVDNVHPEMTLIGDEYVKLEYGESFTDPGVETKVTGRIFGDREQKPELTVVDTTETEYLGTGTITYTATWKNRSCELTRTVEVADTTPPEITLVYRDGYTATWMNGYTEEGYTASDNFDGDITDRVKRDEYRDKVVYSVSDSSGNVATVERPLETSTEAPVMTLLGEQYITLQASTEPFDDPGCSAVDSNGNDLTAYVTVEGEVIPYAVGTYEITYTLSNDLGETASASRTVEVTAVEIPATRTPSKKTIYLTFDDGPGPYTDALLDVLKRYNVKATFFVTGCDSDYEDCIGRAYREGHSIGVHTMCHDYKTIYASEEAFFEDFFAAEEMIYRQTGTYTNIFRFPGGSSNTVSKFNPGIMTRLTTYMTDMGYKYFDWNVDSDDAGSASKTSVVVNNVADGCLEAGSICVVLQHDIKDFSVDAVENIIRWGRNNGYQFLPLDMTSYGSHHTVHN